jgi:hypothetical protein
MNTVSTGASSDAALDQLCINTLRSVRPIEPSTHTALEGFGDFQWRRLGRRLTASISTRQLCRAKLVVAWQGCCSVWLGNHLSKIACSSLTTNCSSASVLDRISRRISRALAVLNTNAPQRQLVASRREILVGSVAVPAPVILESPDQIHQR